MPSRSSSQAQESFPLHPHSASHNGESSRRSSRSILESVQSQGSGKATTTARLGASHDLRSSVTHFLCLSSAANSSVAARKELRRQLLVLRDYLVGMHNKLKGAELLSQGGRSVSKKVEASADFNSCIDVIIATSLAFTEETQDVAKDTLRNVIGRLKAAQDHGDDKTFRAAIVEVVNSVLLCTPMIPPSKDVRATAAAQRKKGEEALHPNGSMKEMSLQNGDAAAATVEPQLKDVCLDFLTMEDGAPVLLEGRWKRWLDYFEAGYIRYVEKLIEEEKRERENCAAAAASEAENDGEESDSATATAVAALTLESVPFFTARQNYWKSTTSAYAQFCYLLLATFFVRTKDFSLNYLARVNKLVQYYAYQLDYADGEPIEVKRGAVEDDDEDEDEEAEEVKVQGEKWETGEADEVRPSRALPPPQFDDSVTRNVQLSARRTVQTEHVPSGEATPEQTQRLPRHHIQVEHIPSVTVSPQRSRLPHHRTHKCFPTQELPEELQPSVEAILTEKKEAAERDTPAHSHVPSVRCTSRLDIADVSAHRQRESAEMESTRKVIKNARDKAAVEGLVTEADERSVLGEMAVEAEQDSAEAKLEEAAYAERVAKNVEALANDAEDEL